MPDENFIRPQARELARRLREPRRFIQCVSGARQVGKTTLALQVAARCKLPYHFASADEPTLRSAAGWLPAQWHEARRLAQNAGKRGAQPVPGGAGALQPAPAYCGACGDLLPAAAR